MKQIQGDWWPDRDAVCFRVAYDFKGADLAIAQCKKLDLVVQAGGNVGAWPKYLKKQFKEVITFEPSPENFRLLERNLTGAQVTAIHKALGRKEGFCSVKENPNNCGDDRTMEGTDIPVVALDDLNLDPDLIYLDIQGDELPALIGSIKTLERCSPVIGLEHDPGLKGKTVGDVRGFLEALGYRLVGSHRQDLIFSK